MASQGSSAGGSVSDFRKMGKTSMEAELSIGAGDSTAMDVVDAIGDVLNTKGAAMNAEIKKNYDEKQKAVDKFGEDLELAFIDMGPEMANLGQESYQRAQDDVYGLREEFVNCAGDKRCEADKMVKLNQLKTKHASDAENAKNLVGLWQGELDEDGNRGESSADVKAMSDDDKGVMEQFVSNKSKRVVYDDEGVLNYAWEVPVLDTDKNEEAEQQQRPVSEEAFSRILESYAAQLWHGDIRKVLTPASILSLENISSDTDPDKFMLSDFDNFIEEVVFMTFEWTSTIEGLKDFLLDRIINEDESLIDFKWRIGKFGETFIYDGEAYYHEYEDKESFLEDVNYSQVIKILEKCWDRACKTEEVFPEDEAMNDRRNGFIAWEQISKGSAVQL